MTGHQYIGETSRPVRERVKEHFDKARKDSFIRAHWMEHHSLEIRCPEFRLKIIGKYRNALRCQLLEALKITLSGTLNKKVNMEQMKSAGWFQM